MVKKITKTKIMSCYLNNYGRKCYLQELAELLNKPHQTIKPYAESLVKEKILIKSKRKKILEYSLNLNNKQVYSYLITAEIEKLIEKLREEPILRILYERLSPHFINNTFIIFGSSVNKVEKESDIDLIFIGKANVNELLKEFREIYNKKMHKVHVNSLD